MLAHNLSHKQPICTFASYSYTRTRGLTLDSLAVFIWSAAATPNLTVHVHWDGDKWAFLIHSFWELSVRLAQRIVGLTEEMEGGSVMSVRKFENAEVPYTCLLLFRPSTSFHLPSSPHWILRPLYWASAADVWSHMSRYGVCRSCNERARSIAGQGGMVFSSSTSLADLRVKQGAYVHP